MNPIDRLIHWLDYEATDRQFIVGLAVTLLVVLDVERHFKQPDKS